MTHDLQMLVASANAAQLAEIADWCADRANQLNELAAEECFKEAADLLGEEVSTDATDQYAQDYRERLRNVRAA